MSSLSRFVALGCVLLLVAGVARAEVPTSMNVQGRLTDNLGAPLAPGLKVLTFKIYDDPVAGTEVWPAGPGEEVLIETNPDGLFNARIGESLPIPPGLFVEPNRWLGITVDDGVHGPIAMPRIRLATSPYTFHSASSQNAGVAELSLNAADFSVGSAAIIDGSIESVDIGSSGAAPGQVMKWTGSEWIPADDNEGTDNDWLLTGNVLESGGEWGLARSGNVLYGDGDSSHVNFGVACTTGTSGSNDPYVTVGGGLGNHAGGASAAVGGGRNNASTGEESVVCGGRNNQAKGRASSVGGGWFNDAQDGETMIGGGAYNVARSRYSTIAGGSYNETDAPVGLHACAVVGGGHQNKAMHQFATVAGGGYNEATGFRSTVGGGMNNTASDTAAVVCGGGNNYARGEYSVVVGGGGAYTSTDSNAATGDWSFVGGGNLNLADGDGSVVVGGSGNYARGGRSVVVGGGKPGADTNSAIGNWSFIGSGYGNIAGGMASIIGGGLLNQTGGSYTVVCGGTNNIAGGASSAVVGGEGNFARGSHSFVGGGGGTSIADTNSAQGKWSVIPGGRANVAAGDYSFAAGRHARALHHGSFVWADSTDANFVTTGANQFLIRASGGVGIGTNSPETDHQLHVKGLSWFELGSGSIAMSTPGGWPGLIMMSPAGKRRDLIVKDLSLHLVTSASSSAPLASNGITIVNDGSVGIGTDDPNFTLDVRGTIGSNTTVYHSDRRWKRNIASLAGSLDIVRSLRGVSYEWRRNEFADMNFSEGTHVGLIAQEVEAVLPELVDTDTEGFKSVEYANLVAVLIEAVKEQQTQIDALTAEVAELKGRVDVSTTVGVAGYHPQEERADFVPDDYIGNEER
ncbi:MAG TPA: tail fiber domain-containing protein [Acidobacteriota bacterium]|nr:tail fiber domain-containing protein [Acidobacteriota bacterium]